MSTIDVRAALDEYANAETGEYINPQNEIGDMAWQDVEDNCERFSRESEAPEAFAALRAVLDLHPRIPGYDGADWFMCATCRLIADDSCPTVRAIATALHLPADA